MLEFITNLLITLGLPVGNLPTWAIAVGTIVGIIIVVYILMEIADALITIGCGLLAVAAIAAILYELFAAG